MATRPSKGDTRWVIKPSGPGLLRTLPLYLGGFLGPFGTLVIIPMLPELRDQFGTDNATISWGFSAYLFPMAALLLVSGTIGERYGKQRALRISLVTFVVASMLVAAAPNLGLFFAARAAQGAANAFFTPLLIAGIADITPEAQLGRRVGIYTSFQAAGGGIAPFAGGLAAAVDWRWAFWSTAAAGVIVLVSVPPDAARPASIRPPISQLLDRRLIMLGIGALAAAAGPIGAGVLVGLKARDVLDMEPTTAGLLLAGGSIGSTLLAPSFGRLLDRYGPRTCGIWSTVIVSVLVAGLGATDTVATTAIVYAIGGAMFGAVIVVFQAVGASIMPDNRGGALSAVMSFRFIGHAIGPLLWVPIFDRSVGAAFVGSALLGIITIVAVMAAIPRPEQDGEDGLGTARDSDTPADTNAPQR